MDRARRGDRVRALVAAVGAGDRHGGRHDGRGEMTLRNASFFRVYLQNVLLCVVPLPVVALDVRPETCLKRGWPRR